MITSEQIKALGYQARTAGQVNVEIVLFALTAAMMLEETDVLVKAIASPMNKIMDTAKARGMFKL